MRALPGPLEAVDVRITQWMARYGVVTLRVALGLVFLWFGALKIVPRPHEHGAPETRTPRGGGRVDVGSGFDHLAIQVDTLAATLKRLTEAGLEPEPVQYPAGPRGPKTSSLTDPDGYRIELVEWPPGHPDGISAADFS
jgi:lactoylglutathione lyase